MYWWNVSKLAEDLREGRVDEGERFKYFLATFVAWNILVLVLINSGVPFDVDRLISAAVNLTVAIIGIILCYRINKSGDDTDFVGRMICLGWPVGVWYVALISVSFLFFGILESGKIWSVLHNFAGFWFIVGYYFTICGYLATVAKAKRVESLQRQEADWSALEVAVAAIGGIGVVPIMMLTLAWVPDFGRHHLIEQTLVCLVVVLWMLLFGSILAWLRRRSMKHVPSPNHVNQ